MMPQLLKKMWVEGREQIGSKLFFRLIDKKIAGEKEKSVHVKIHYSVHE